VLLKNKEPGSTLALLPLGMKTFGSVVSLIGQKIVIAEQELMFT